MVGAGLYRNTLFNSEKRGWGRFAKQCQIIHIVYKLLIFRLETKIM